MDLARRPLPPGVNICAPASGSSVSSPVQVNGDRNSHRNHRQYAIVGGRSEEVLHRFRFTQYFGQPVRRHSSLRRPRHQHRGPKVGNRRQRNREVTAEFLTVQVLGPSGESLLFFSGCLKTSAFAFKPQIAAQSVAQNSFATSTGNSPRPIHLQESSQRSSTELRRTAPYPPRTSANADSHIARNISGSSTP